MPGPRRNIADRLSRRTARVSGISWLRRGYLLVRRLLERGGFQLVYASYDSPIPDLASLPPAFFDRPSPLRGITFSEAVQIEFLEQQLADFCREFDPPKSAAESGPHRFYLRNSTYESVDAELLYAMVRQFQPRRIMELGSGFSTLIIREALARDQTAVADVLRTYDPYRSDLVPPEIAVTAQAAQDIPEARFEELEADDLLFVDTSHTVKLGGDVNRIVLDILPTLRPGVIVHFHDIFLPFPYSRGHLADAHFWTEQYLLQAFLSGNPDWEVLFGAFAVARAAPDRLAAVVPSFGPGVNPGAFWIRRL